MLDGDIDSGHYAYRRRWQHYNACLAAGKRVDEANRYFATSEDIVPGEWQTLLFLRTYLQFKGQQLTLAARKKLLGVLEEYFDKRLERSKWNPIEHHGTSGNHSIVAYSAYLLIAQALDRGKYRGLAREKFIRWVQHQGRFGRDEVNSPHYLERSLLPLMNLYDFADDPQVRLWAQMAIDQLAAEFALMSLHNVRGGPWCRAHYHHSPGVAEINDGRQDAFSVCGYVWFGGSPTPSYIFTDQILSYGFLITTKYHPPMAVVLLADPKVRGTYELRSHRSPVKGSLLTKRQEWDMYYYMTPRYSLAALQDRVELDNHLTNRTTRPPDYVNTQVWELTFADPLKILGPKRRLDVTTGGPDPVFEEHNPNTANMQYKNVLFYKGDCLDYNGNLASNGKKLQERSAGREYHFWCIPTPEGEVYVAAIHFAEAEAGIIEVSTDADHADFGSFRHDILDNPAACRDAGLYTRYINCRGEEIVYDHGKATVNGKSLALHGYPLYDSPYMRSERGSGVIDVTIAGRSLHLDFRDANRPVRRDRQP